MEGSSKQTPHLRFHKQPSPSPPPPHLHACALPPSVRAPSPALQPSPSPRPADRRVHALPLTKATLVLFVSRLVPVGQCGMLRRLLLLILLLSFRHRGCGNGCSRIWRAVRKGHTRFVSASGWAVGRETEAFAMPLPAGCGSAAASSTPGPRSVCRAAGGCASPV